MKTDKVKIQRYMVSINRIKCGTARKISFFLLQDRLQDFLVNLMKIVV